jgi:predicted metal-dependent TIM-barrel fold hydrolase
MGKHSGNMAGGVGIGSEIKRAITQQVDAAAETAVPCIGYSWRANKEHGRAEVVIVGKHPLAIDPVAICIDPINALKLVALIAEGMSESMIAGARMAAQLTKAPVQGA